PEWAAGLVVEIAYAAGLLASGGSVDGEWLPTSSYDVWRVRATEDRWAVLASAWAAMDRVPGLIGERDDRDRPLDPLHPDVRTRRLAGLAAAGPGLAPAAASGLARLAWEQPRRRGAQRDRLAEFTLREAEQVGVTGLGILSGHGRGIVRGDGTAAGLLAPLL